MKTESNKIILNYTQKNKADLLTAVLQDADFSLKSKRNFVLAEYNLKSKIKALRVPHLAKPQNVSKQLKPKFRKKKIGERVCERLY